MSKTAGSDPDSPTESMIDRAVRITKAFKPGESVLSLADLAARTRLPKSSVHRLVQVLVEHNLMAAAGNGGYSLGIGLWELGVLAISSMASLKDLEPYARKTAEQFGETSHIGVLDGRDVVYIVRVASPRAVAVQTYVGQRVPAHCTATGKALLAWQSDELLEELLAAPLGRFTDRTVTDPSVLRSELRTIREHGYSTNFAGWQSDMCGAASTILGLEGRAVGSIGIAGPTYRFNEQSLEDAGAQLKVTAAEISRRMGYLNWASRHGCG